MQKFTSLLLFDAYTTFYLSIAIELILEFYSPTVCFR